MDKNAILISVACIYKDKRGKRQWVIVKEEKDTEWELPRVLVRKTESSARGSIRMAGEMLGLDIKVLEEAGRAGGITTVNGKTVSQRHLYYLAQIREEVGEVIGFEEFEWLEYAKAIRRLPAKRDQQMLRAANTELKAWEKREKEKEKLQPKELTESK